MSPTFGSLVRETCVFVCVCVWEPSLGSGDKSCSPLKNSLWHLRDNWHCLSFPFFPFIFPGVTPLAPMKSSSQGLLFERSHPESERCTKGLRRRSCHPSRCLDQDITPTFNSVSASTSQPSVRGSEMSPLYLSTSGQERRVGREQMWEDCY